MLAILGIGFASKTAFKFGLSALSNVCSSKKKAASKPKFIGLADSLHSAKATSNLVQIQEEANEF